MGLIKKVLKKLGEIIDRVAEALFGRQRPAPQPVPIPVRNDR
ncbi:MAG: DNA topoisomerase I [Pseudanabaenaceae cyanobacterium]